MRLKIDKLTSKIVNTRNGPKPKLGIKSGDTWYGCFAGTTTANWKEGQEIDVEVRERIWEGKTYYDIVFPRNGNAGYGAELAEIKRKLDLILSLIQRRGEDIDLEPPPEAF